MNLGRRHTRPGYILVVIMALLVLSSTLLVAVGRESMKRSLQARLETEEVIRRWQTQSCRDAILPFAESILVGEEARQMAPVPTMRITVRLGADSYRMILSDETAKANVNALLDAVDKSTAEDRIRQSLSGTGLAGAVRLLPAIEEDLTPPTTAPSSAQSDGAPTTRDWISGWGQIFDALPADRLTDPPGRSPIDRLTLFGAGAINVMRAAPEALQLAEGEMLSQIDVSRLIQARNKWLLDSLAQTSRPGAPGAAGRNGAGADPISALLAQAKVTTKHRGQLGLVTQSTCHSLWIIVDDGRRSWRQLLVRDLANPQRPVNAIFVW